MKKNSEKVYVKVTSEFDSTGYMHFHYLVGRTHFSN